MGLFFFRVPSGLCIYFITSSLWGIAERQLVKKTIPPAPVTATPGTVEGTVAKRTERADGKPSFADRIRTAAGLPGEEPKPIVPPSQRRRPPAKKRK